MNQNDAPTMLNKPLTEAEARASVDRDLTAVDESLTTVIFHFETALNNFRTLAARSAATASVSQDDPTTMSTFAWAVAEHLANVQRIVQVSEQVLIGTEEMLKADLKTKPVAAA